MSQKPEKTMPQFQLFCLYSEGLGTAIPKTCWSFYVDSCWLAVGSWQVLVVRLITQHIKSCQSINPDLNMTHCPLCNPLKPQATGQPEPFGPDVLDLHGTRSDLP